jgi:hypothetical protein
MTVTQGNLDAARLSGASSVGTLDVNSIGGGSLQLMFAKLQLVLSGSSRSNAMGYMNDIQKTQEEQKQLAAMLQEARQLQTEAKSSGVTTEIPDDMLAYMDDKELALASSKEERKTASAMLQQAQQLQARAAAIGNVTVMPAEMKTYMGAHGLAWNKSGGDDLHHRSEWQVSIDSLQGHLDSLTSYSADQWEVAIKSLQARMDALGTSTQQKMLLAQDHMSQYNSYLTGANSVIQQGNQTLGELARAR